MGTNTNDGSFLLETYECELGAELYADGKLYVTLPNGASTGASFNMQVEWEEMVPGGDTGTGYEVLRSISNGIYNTIGPGGNSSISYQADLYNNNRTLRISKAKFFKGFGSLFRLYFRAKITIGNGLVDDTPIYSRIARVSLKPCPLQVISDIKLHQSPAKNIGFLLKIKKISFKNPSVKDVAENVAKSIPIMTKECLDGKYGVNDPFDAFSIGNFSTMNNKTIVGSRVKQDDTYILLGDPETIDDGVIESIWNPGVGYSISYDHMAPGMFNTLQMDEVLSNFGGLTFFATKVDWVDASQVPPGSPEYIKKYNQSVGTQLPLIIKKGKIKIGITDGIQKVNSSPYTKSREDSVTILTDNIELVGFDKPNPGLYFEVIEVIGIKDQETSEDPIICSTKC